MKGQYYRSDLIIVTLFRNFREFHGRMLSLSRVMKKKDSPLLLYGVDLFSARIHTGWRLLC